VGGFKTGLLVGVLATAVVALGVAVVVLASDDSDGKPSKTVTSADRKPASNDTGNGDASADPDTPCLIPYGDPPTTELEMDLRTSELDCAEAESIYTTLKDRDAVAFGVGLEEPGRFRGWACIEHPLAAHPLFAHCSSPGKRFLILSLEPAAHTGGAPPAPEPPPGSRIKCGDLAESGAGTYNVVANGANCDTALHMAYLWQEICFAPDRGPNPCPVIDGFTCLSTEVGLELVTIQCIKGRRVVSFENGA
jgi:hypothetical protein